MKYSDIIGQQHIKEHFINAVKNNTVSHAYIINGEKSTGKSMLAETFAMSVMCEGEDEKPCMKCKSCTKIANKCNPDFIKLIRDTEKKADIIRIDEIRSQIIDSMYDRPYNGHHKVYIIEDADKMNVQAQNAILKTLEEPPKYAVLLLTTTNVERLLPTIISRCIILNMRPVKDNIIKQFLREKGGVSEDGIDIITAIAGGNVGRAKLLLDDDEFINFQDSITDILIDIPRTGYRRILEAVDTICILTGRDKKKKTKTKSKYGPEDVFDIFMLWYRDILLYKATDDIEGLIFRNHKTEIAIQAGFFRFDALDKIFHEIEDARGKIRSFINYEATMELLLINIQEISK
ncbi:MAG: DNA polymerase III subunit [Lachnospiraceae bacterium]|nr:DNA polymerase III subunit [Lachnospiraceae bacterium]MDY5640322.1 DNA polymerase III subunit [Lachnospiraceae bacterium]